MKNCKVWWLLLGYQRRDKRTCNVVAGRSPPPLGKDRFSKAYFRVFQDFNNTSTVQADFDIMLLKSHSYSCC